MPRKPRVHYSGAIYHIIARGNNKEFILNLDNDKKHYIYLIHKYKERFAFKLYGYVIMDNHIHLLLEVAEVADVPLSKIMQGIQQSYTQYYNHLYNRVGHVFQQRYKAILCEKDAYLLTLLKYIHNNPVRAGKTLTIDYPWSSHRSYLEGCSSLVDINFMLDYFADNMKTAVKEYIDFMDLDQPESLEMNEQVKQSYLEHTTTQTYDNSGNADNKLQMNISLEQIVKLVANKMQIDESLIGIKCRMRKIVRSRNIVIYLLVKHKLIDKVELMEKLAVSSYQITRGYYEVAQNKESQLIVKEVEREITQ